MTEPREHDDLEPDDFIRSQLPEQNEMWAAVADTLDEWLHRLHGITCSKHNAGAFLDWLALRGYRVEAIEPPIDYAELFRDSQFTVLPRDQYPRPVGAIDLKPTPAICRHCGLQPGSPRCPVCHLPKEEDK